MLRILVVICGLVLMGAPAQAEPEVHVVGIYEGFDRTDGKIHGPRALVNLDRPGAEVVLVLMSYRAVRWEVELATGTAAPTVVVSQFAGDDRRSEVWLNGTPLADPVQMDLPRSYKPYGNRFRELVAEVPERFGVARMASFSGGYGAKTTPFEVTEVVDDARYDIDYLKGTVRAEVVPESLRPLIGPEAAAAPAAVRLTGKGFEVAGVDGTAQVIALPLDMPEVSWPMGAARDAAGGTLYGVTLGGEGFLYAYSEADQRWRIVRSMAQMDAQALFLDAAGRRLIMPLGLNKAGHLAIMDLDAGDDAPMQIVEMGEMPGLADLYDPGNGPDPNLVPLGIDGDKLLLIAGIDPRFSRVMPGQAAQWRAFLVDIGTGAVDLVGYDDPAPDE